MTFQEAIPIIEGRLYAWSMRKLEPPEAAISGVYDPELLPPQKKAQRSTSQPESWVIRHQYEMWEGTVIEKVLEGMNTELQNLVKMRYLNRWTWQRIADALKVGERTVFRLRDHVLLVMAYEFGLLREDEAS